MLRFRKTLAFLALTFASCTGSVTFRSTTDYTLDIGTYYSSNFGNVQGLVTADSISSIPCPGPGPVGDTACQAHVPITGAGNDIVLRCNAMNLCDPDPYRFAVSVGTKDLAMLAAPHLRVLDKVELREVELTVNRNTTNVNLPSFEVRWGPESASTGSLDTATAVLATVDPIAAGQTGAVPVALDRAQFDSLDTYVRSTSTKTQFFLATTYDAAPGMPIPSGAYDVTLGLILKASGTLH